LHSKPWRAIIVSGETNHELETVIAQLPPADLAGLAYWLQEFQASQETQAQDQEADAWDRQIATDVQAGRLDALVARAKEQVQDGQYRQISPDKPLAP